MKKLVDDHCQEAGLKAGTNQNLSKFKRDKSISRDPHLGSLKDTGVCFWLGAIQNINQQEDVPPRLGIRPLWLRPRLAVGARRGRASARYYLALSQIALLSILLRRVSVYAADT